MSDVAQIARICYVTMQRIDFELSGEGQTMWKRQDTKIKESYISIVDALIKSKEASGMEDLRSIRFDDKEVDFCVPDEVLPALQEVKSNIFKSIVSNLGDENDNNK